MVARKVGRPKSATVRKPKEEEKKVVITKEEENEKRIKELEAMIAHLVENQESKDGFDEVDIRQEEYVKVISLCPYELILNTRVDRKGNQYTFKKPFEQKRILYGDLVKIMEAHSEHTDFLKEGYYYIADSRVVRRHGLNDVYDSLLNEEQIRKIIAGDQKDVLTIFESAGRAQKTFVCDFIINKMVDGEDVDLNVIDNLSRLSGIDIKEKADEAKKYKAMRVAN